jgi:hypothetical protein
MLQSLDSNHVACPILLWASTVAGQRDDEIGRIGRAHLDEESESDCVERLRSSWDTVRGIAFIVVRSRLD